MARNLELTPEAEAILTAIEYAPSSGPTAPDLMGVMPPGWVPREPCKNGSPCHVSAPRGARTGTQGRKGAVDRSRVPFNLSLEICEHIEASL